MSKVKTPEFDNQVVDYLYDDLPDVQREDFCATLKSDAEGAAEVESFGTLLSIYREESDELTPSVAAAERLMREAERAHLTVWARLFGGLLPRMILRPAVGFAMVAALVIGGGVFWVLSQDLGQGPERAATSAERAESSSDRTVASAPAPVSTAGSTRTVLAEKGRFELSGRRGRDLDEVATDGKDRGVDKAGLKTRAVGGSAGDGFRYKSNQQGALAAGDDSERERRVLKDRLRGLRQNRRPAKAKKRGYFSINNNTRGAGRATGSAGQAKPAARSERRSRPSAPAPAQVADLRRSVINKVTKAQKAPQGKRAQKKKLAPPALHSSARKNLAKGKVAVACRMFGSLVRGHRSYNRRADALLGWARCEIARGSFSRARQIVRQLVSQYPKWKKTGATLVAQINRLQARAALRAQRVKRVRRKAVPSRAAPARRARSRRSTTSD